MVTKRDPTPRTKRAVKPKKAKPEPTLWDKLDAIAHSIPREEQAKFPRDSARNLHHYMYGGPRQEPE